MPTITQWSLIGVLVAAIGIFFARQSSPNLIEHCCESSEDRALESLSSHTTYEFGPDAKDRTALGCAASRGFIRLVTALLRVGGDNIAYAKRRNTESPLILAIKNTHWEVANVLIDAKGIDPHAKDKRGRTALSWTAGKAPEHALTKDLMHQPVQRLDGSMTGEHILLRLVDLALSKDPSLVREKSKGDLRSPLMYAADSGSTDSVAIILSRGGALDLLERDAEGVTPLHSAVKRASLPMVRTMLRTLQVNHSDIFRAALSAGDKHGEPAVMAALRSTHRTGIDMFEDFRSTKMFDFSKVYANRTSLGVAARYGNVLAIKALLVDGVDVNGEDDEGITPISFAAFSGHDEIVALLLQAGADANHLDKKKNPPLLYALAGGREAPIARLEPLTTATFPRDANGDPILSNLPIWAKEHINLWSVTNYKTD